MSEHTMTVLRGSGVVFLPGLGDFGELLSRDEQMAACQSSDLSAANLLPIPRQNTVEQIWFSYACTQFESVIASTVYNSGMSIAVTWISIDQSCSALWQQCTSRPTQNDEWGDDLPVRQIPGW